MKSNDEINDLQNRNNGSNGNNNETPDIITSAFNEDLGPLPPEQIANLHDLESGQLDEKATNKSEAGYSNADLNPRPKDVETRTGISQENGRRRGNEGIWAASESPPRILLETIGPDNCPSTSCDSNLFPLPPTQISANSEDLWEKRRSFHAKMDMQNNNEGSGNDDRAIFNTNTNNMHSPSLNEANPLASPSSEHNAENCPSSGGVENNRTTHATASLARGGIDQQSTIHILEATLVEEETPPLIYDAIPIPENGNNNIGDFHQHENGNDDAKDFETASETSSGSGNSNKGRKRRCIIFISLVGGLIIGGVAATVGSLLVPTRGNNKSNDAIVELDDGASSPTNVFSNESQDANEVRHTNDGYSPTAPPFFENSPSMYPSVSKDEQGGYLHSFFTQPSYFPIDIKLPSPKPMPIFSSTPPSSSSQPTPSPTDIVVATDTPSVGEHEENVVVNHQTSETTQEDKETEDTTIDNWEYLYYGYDYDDEDSTNAPTLEPILSSPSPPPPSLTLLPDISTLFPSNHPTSSAPTPKPTFSPIVISSTGTPSPTDITFVEESVNELVDNVQTPETAQEGDAEEDSAETRTFKITASDGGVQDQFGYSVSISGDRAIVGAYDRTTRIWIGSVHVYSWNGSRWLEDAKLVPSDGADDAKFGNSVAIHGDRAIVGDADALGSAYIFAFDGTSWYEQAKLVASDGADFYFGQSVAISGERAVVGSPWDRKAGYDTGSAYIFVWDGASWREEAKFVASDGAADDRFGFSVGISGDTVIVGAVWDVHEEYRSGSAYIFSLNESTWNEEAKLTAIDGAGDDYFGVSVGISGDRAIVGAFWDDDAGSSSGSAYIFARNGANWYQEAKLVASDGATDDRFGASVAISGDRVIVGAQFDDDAGSGSGSAYIFTWNGSSWHEEVKFVASDGADWDDFGWSVAIDGDRAIVGAPGDDDKGSDSGSAYVIHMI
mmetsp:Transcript_4521/g.8667  ORF Transcript_4521/g.8667 Transcript_4521/m.8667 type:complete len:954 (+) Transcript_4521:281-3142(+)